MFLNNKYKLNRTKIVHNLDFISSILLYEGSLLAVTEGASYSTPNSEIEPPGGYVDTAGMDTAGMDTAKYNVSDKNVDNLGNQVGVAAFAAVAINFGTVEVDHTQHPAGFPLQHHHDKKLLV